MTGWKWIGLASNGTAKCWLNEVVVENDVP